METVAWILIALSPILFWPLLVRRHVAIRTYREFSKMLVSLDRDILEAQMGARPVTALLNERDFISTLGKGISLFTGGLVELNFATAVEPEDLELIKESSTENGDPFKPSLFQGKSFELAALCWLAISGFYGKPERFWCWNVAYYSWRILALRNEDGSIPMDNVQVIMLFKKVFGRHPIAQRA